MSEGQEDFIDELQQSPRENFSRKLDECLTDFEEQVQTSLEKKFSGILDMVSDADEALDVRVRESLNATTEKIVAMLGGIEIQDVPAALSEPDSTAPPSSDDSQRTAHSKGLMGIIACAVACVLLLLGTGAMVTSQLKENSRLRESNRELLKDAKTIEKAIRIMKAEQKAKSPR